MQTSSKVTSAKKVGILASLFDGLLGAEKTYPVESAGGKGHYYESMGAINQKFNARSSQRKRRKLARRTA